MPIFLKEVASIVNSFSLTAASDVINDLEPIAQNHYPMGKSSPNYHSVFFKNKNNKILVLERNWKQFKQQLKGYLPILTEIKGGRWKTEVSQLDTYCLFQIKACIIQITIYPDLRVVKVKTA